MAIRREGTGSEAPSDFGQRSFGTIRVRAWAYFGWRDLFPSVLLALTAPRRLKLLQNPGARTATASGTTERSVSG